MFCYVTKVQLFQGDFLESEAFLLSCKVNCFVRRDYSPKSLKERSFVVSECTRLTALFLNELVHAIAKDK